MTASASSSDELHAYLAEVLAAANSPLTVVTAVPSREPLGDSLSSRVAVRKQLRWPTH